VSMSYNEKSDGLRPFQYTINLIVNVGQMCSNSKCRISVSKFIYI